jgi:hypothetical protein
MKIKGTKSAVIGRTERIKEKQKKCMSKKKIQQRRKDVQNEK